ncbi:ABC transporter ATP-binding protein [Pontiella sulfatireligans]|uniref:Trehalose import ATP-binding protein SugC n=1 Tax=Pontiella sulfatireligans TaxID=2750658 RepID=A0A6C2UNL5_9BACT|nr:ABC transporter ATP-binding protein [Pontiella sulfatireligans]VGO21855.1 Trehalose import ATP-binding protein SugC [Pontiella sulfatireligans]
MNALEIKDLSMRAGLFSVGKLSLTIGEGEYFTLMGHTGSGKSLLLKAVCGLARIETGRIRIHGEDVTELEPRFRGVGYVPQDGGLFPHLSVQRNIVFPLIVRGLSFDQAAAETAEVVETLGLTPLLDRAIRGLSGGERQKVALARALACRPRLLILDEPLCSLDEPARYEICTELCRVQKRFNLATLHVCHSRAEAEQVSDGVGVMHGGQLIETGVLKEILEESGHEAVQRLFNINGATL